jgi:hypothetical protein
MEMSYVGEVEVCCEVANAYDRGDKESEPELPALVKQALVPEPTYASFELHPNA